MTAYVQAGTAYTYKASFEVDGELVHPSAASITVLKNDGSVADSINNIALTIGADATFATYLISANANTTSQTNELRVVRIKFTYDSKDYSYEEIYNLRSGLIIPVTKQDVRALVSMSPSELPDENIDLYLAYSQVDTDLNNTLGAIISAGGDNLPQIQQAITARAAMNSCRFIELMVLQSEQSDNSLYRRFEQMDFAALLLRLTNIYNGLVGLVLEDAGEPISLFLVGTGTDPVTGA